MANRDFALNRNELILRALNKAGVVGRGESLNADDTSLLVDNANMLIKHLGAKGLHLWTNVRATVPLVDGQIRYSLGTGGDTFFLGTLDSVTSDDVATAASSGASTLVVDDGTKFTASDTILVRLDNDDLQEITVSSVSTNTLTLGSSLNGAVAVDNKVYNITSLGQIRPKKITSAVIRNADNVDTEVEIVSSTEYDKLSSKQMDASRITQVMYEPSLSTGTLHVYPTPEDSSYVLILTYEETLLDVDASTDNLDMPQEWQLTFVYGLASILADDFGLYDRAAWLKNRYQEFLMDAETWDRENSSLQIKVNI